MATDLEVTLEKLLADPEASIEVTTEQAADLLGRLARAVAVLRRRVAVEGASEGHDQPPASPASPMTSAPAWSESDLLTIDEAAAMLRVTPRWLYRHARGLSFSRKLSRKVLRFSRSGIARWLASRKT